MLISQKGRGYGFLKLYIIGKVIKLYNRWCKNSLKKTKLFLSKEANNVVSFKLFKAAKENHFQFICQIFQRMWNN